MNKSNSIEAIDKTSLSDQTKFQLDEISKIENYFIKETNQRKSCSKKLRKYVPACEKTNKTIIRTIKPTSEIWVSMKDVGSSMGVKNI